MEVFNKEIIFSGVLCLCYTHKLKKNDIFPYELVPISTALLKDTREGRCSASKNDLKIALKVEVPMRDIIPEQLSLMGFQ